MLLLQTRPRRPAPSCWPSHPHLEALGPSLASLAGLAWVRERSCSRPSNLWCSPARQVNENARKDLKEGLRLYNTENNVGLKNAWNIIQAEVRLRQPRRGQAESGRWPGPSGCLSRWHLPERVDRALYQGIRQKRDEEVSTEASGAGHRSGGLRELWGEL